MIKVKVYSSVLSFNHFEKLFPNSSQIWGFIDFDYNDRKNFVKYDHIVVLDFYDENILPSYFCMSSILFLLEPFSIKKYREVYLKQFSLVVTSKTQFRLKNILNTQLGYPWLALKTYNEIKNDNNIIKTKLLCIVLSNKSITPGHKKRYDFFLKLKLLFGDLLDVYGRGINDFDDKYLLLNDYKYSIAIENSTEQFNITEKLTDCFCSLTFPFYYGPIQTENFYSDRSYCRIDINDINYSFEIIKSIIFDKNHYEQSKPFLIASKFLYLDKYQLIPNLADIILRNSNLLIKEQLISPSSKHLNRIHNMKLKYYSSYFIFLNKIYNKLIFFIKKFFLIDKFIWAIHRWNKDKGDITLRLNYNLNKNSIVFDVGGYKGWFAENIYSRYGSKIYVFEPVTSFYNNLEIKFKNIKEIKVHNFGLSDIDKKDIISVSENASSIYLKDKNNSQQITLMSINNFINKNEIIEIDLLKLNIEGGEFFVIPALIESGLVKKIKNIQVQFHSFVPNSKIKREKIREQLSETHILSYNYYFVWENWVLK